MSYTPIVPLSGYAGWAFLNRTMDKQKVAFVASADLQSTETYFRDKIGTVKSAEDLVSDRRLLGVALGAFGLDDDINNRYFIRKVLEEGTLDADSLGNKLTDKRYLALSKAFGFGDYSIPRTVLSDFPDEILQNYEEHQFEIAIGNSDETLRMALTVQRELPELAGKSTSENTKWYSIIGSKTLSAAIQTALGLPASVSSLDVDQQVTIYRQKADAVFGASDPAQFTDADKLDKLVKLYLLRGELTAVRSQSSQSIALQLLQDHGAGRSISLLL